MDEITLDLITRLFIADSGDGGGYYDQSGVCAIVGRLRDHLESTGQWTWHKYAEPILKGETNELEND